jgi:hypothetical protein
MRANHEHESIWQALASSEAHVAVRLGLSITVGILLAGLGLLGAWMVGLAYEVRYLPDEVFALGLLGASVLWFVALWLIWRRVLRARMLLLPIIATLAIGVLTIFGCYLAGELIHYEDELLMLALVLCGGALVIFVWLAALHRLLQGRAVIGADHQVNVRCPSCDYSLVGLTELRCPECGLRFTIDELIRAQGYGRVVPGAASPGPPLAARKPEAEDARREGDPVPLPE